mmetsp:Transcript_64213/g.178382  ORF Transcript_64213/g.178382 Transcript_64213/m.178382 type:complete len:214 (+) Transcript_64213:293-934(+)
MLGMPLWLPPLWAVSRWVSVMMRCAPTGLRTGPSTDGDCVRCRLPSGLRCCPIGCQVRCPPTYQTIHCSSLILGLALLLLFGMLTPRNSTTLGNDILLHLRRCGARLAHLVAGAALRGSPLLIHRMLQLPGFLRTCAVSPALQLCLVLCCSPPLSCPSSPTSGMMRSLPSCLSCSLPIRMMSTLPSRRTCSLLGCRMRSQPSCRLCTLLSFQL